MYSKAVYAFEILDVVNRNARNMRNMVLLNDPVEIEKDRQKMLNNERNKLD